MKARNRQFKKIDALAGADLMVSRLLVVFAEFEREQRAKHAKAAIQRKKAGRECDNRA